MEGSKNYANEPVIDSILKELRTKTINPGALPPLSEFPTILAKILKSLPDTYPYTPKTEDPGLHFQSVHKAKLFISAPFLYLEKPIFLDERVNGFSEFISQIDDDVIIREIRFKRDEFVQKLQLIQQRFMIIGVPYYYRSKAYLACLRGEAAREIMGTPGFDYALEWSYFLIVLSTCVSSGNIDLYSFTREENFKVYDDLGLAIKQKLTMIKAVPSCSIDDKHRCLSLLKEFVLKHVAAFENQDFVPSMANLEVIADAITKLRIRSLRC